MPCVVLVVVVVVVRAYVRISCHLEMAFVDTRELGGLVSGDARQCS